MSYQVLKLIVYVFSVLSAMYGLSCFHYEKYILKGKLKQFYCLYIILFFYFCFQNNENIK